MKYARKWDVVDMSDNSEPLGTQGWRQFSTSREEMLDAYERAIEHASGDEVKTDHGRVAEAELRKWLIEFLPKRFGVTSGNILSQGKLEGEKLPHYDVIIYDQLESPVLWVKDNPDQSQAGLTRAIPCEYVRAIIEVKSAFDSTTASKSVEHLYDLESLLAGVDEPNDRYKRFLPKNVVLSTVFFESRILNLKEALNKLNDLIKLRGFFWGIILRGEGQPDDLAGSLYRIMAMPPELFSSDQSIIVQSDPIDHEREKVSTMLIWSPFAFSQYVFGLLDILKGNFQPGVMPSLYGLPFQIPPKIFDRKS
jgi:hypothetical protein